LIRDLKSLIFLVQNRKNYPKASIGFGSRVTNSIFDGPDVKIGRDCYIRSSRFSRGVMIQDSCAIFDSTFDNNSAVYSHCSLSKVKFGPFSYVNEHSAMGGITIGKFCSIGPHFVCGYGEHPTNFISTSPVFYSTRGQCGVSFTDKDCFEERLETRIGNDVWIGGRVFVRDGVKIGNGALIAAGAVVVADVPDYAVVGGVPAKLIRYRFGEDIIRELLDIKWWDWNEDRLREAQPLLSQADATSFVMWAKRHKA